VSDRELQTSSWAALLDKIVKFQQQQRLCVIRDLSAHDVVMRIMRRENYFIGLINKGVLAVPIPAWVPGSGPLAHHAGNSVPRRLLLTRTLEWSLNWCILQQMFDKYVFLHAYCFLISVSSKCLEL
jgi:autophagy-related protein 9